MADPLTLDLFAGQLYTRFHLELERNDHAELQLIRTFDLGSTQTHEQFSILFCGPDGQVLPQRIYRLRHADLGTLELFLVPVGRDPQGVLYEAVFNRPRQTPRETTAEPSGA